MRTTIVSSLAQNCGCADLMEKIGLKIQLVLQSRHYIKIYITINCAVSWKKMCNGVIHFFVQSNSLLFTFLSLDNGLATIVYFITFQIIIQVVLNWQLDKKLFLTISIS